MPLNLKFLMFAPAGLAVVLACTAGGEVIPDGDAGGSGGSGGGVIPSGGSSVSGSPTMTGGTGMMPTGGTGTGGASGGASGSGTVVGGASGSGGSGGTGTNEPDPYEAVKIFDGWRVDMLCTNDPGKDFLSPNCQQGGDICNMKDDNGGKTTFTIAKKVGGDANKLYKFRVRIRGVVEPKSFNDATCPPLFGATDKPMRVCKCTDGSCIPNESGFNWMRLSISAPAQRYWINSSLDAVSHRVEVIDGEFDMEARGQADVEYFFDNLNTGEIRNCSNKIAPGLPFADGNFFVLDIIPGSVTAVAAQ